MTRKHGDPPADAPETFQSADHYERSLIEDAEAGDHEAGRELLSLCASGLRARTLSPVLSEYLAQHLEAYLEHDVPLERALCVEPERGRGRPADPLPQWQLELAAFDMVLERQELGIEERNRILDEVRQKTNVSGKGLDRSEAHKIREKFDAVKASSDQQLLALMGDTLREILLQFSPQSPA